MVQAPSTDVVAIRDNGRPTDGPLAVAPLCEEPA